MPEEKLGYLRGRLDAQEKSIEALAKLVKEGIKEGRVARAEQAKCLRKLADESTVNRTVFRIIKWVAGIIGTVFVLDMADIGELLISDDIGEE